MDEVALNIYGAGSEIYLLHLLLYLCYMLLGRLDNLYSLGLIEACRIDVRLACFTSCVGCYADIYA